MFRHFLLVKTSSKIRPGEFVPGAKVEPQAPQVEETSEGRFRYEPASHLSDKASDVLSDTSPANARLRGWLGTLSL